MNDIYFAVLSDIENFVERFFLGDVAIIYPAIEILQRLRLIPGHYKRSYIGFALSDKLSYNVIAKKTAAAGNDKCFIHYDTSARNIFHPNNMLYLFFCQ